MATAGQRRARWLAVVLALCSAASLEGRRARAAMPLVAANFGRRYDALGFQWDVDPRGMIMDGTHDCFDGGLALLVNGAPFQPTQPARMRADGLEYVLQGTLAGCEVTRRVLLDQERGAVRYLESVRNPGGREVRFQLAVRSMLGSSFQQMLTSSGAYFAGGPLGKKDVGVVTLSTRRPCVVFLVADRNTKHRPVVVNQANRTVEFHYQLRVPAGRTISIMHLCAQRRSLSAANVAEAFRPFYKRRLVRPGVPSRLRSTVLNFRVGFGFAVDYAPGQMFQSVLELVEQLDVDRGELDVLMMQEDARLPGAARGGPLRVAGHFGKTNVALDDLALLLGGGGVGRPMRVYLRHGEVLTGEVETKRLEFRTKGGTTLPLSVGQIHALVMHLDPRDGKPKGKGAVFLTTRLGDRLSLTAGQKLTLDAVTPWGALRVPLETLAAVSYVREPQPGWRLTLADGSRLSVLLRGKEVVATTARYGAIKLRPQEIAMVTRVREKKDGEPRVDAPHALLAGGNRIVGSIDAPKVRIVTAAGVTAIDPKTIRRAERTDEGTPGQLPVFAFELSDGGRLSGRFEDRVVPIRCAGAVLRVPVLHFLGYQVPGPPAPQAEERQAVGQRPAGVLDEAPQLPPP